jgi:hypothetical protein
LFGSISFSVAYLVLYLLIDARVGHRKKRSRVDGDYITGDFERECVDLCRLAFPVSMFAWIQETFFFLDQDKDEQFVHDWVLQHLGHAEEYMLDIYRREVAVLASIDFGTCYMHYSY